MLPEEVMQWAKAAAVVGGVVVGIFAVFSPSWVWFRKQLFGWGSAVLCLFGTVLIVSSIFRTVNVAVAPSGLELKLAELEKQMAESRAAINETNRKFTQVTASFSSANSQSAELTKIKNDLQQLANKIQQSETTVTRLINALPDDYVRTVRPRTNWIPQAPEPGQQFEMRPEPKEAPERAR
jgi:hypothetical protein